MDLSEKSRDKKDSDWPIYPRPISKVQYELRTLPLQSEISKIRKVMCHSCSVLKGQWKTVKQSSSKSYQDIKDKLANYGIRKDNLAVQGGSVGGAMLLGYLLARKKPLWQRILYPTLGGILVGGAFYFSITDNRLWAKNQLQVQLDGIWPKKK